MANSRTDDLTRAPEPELYLSLWQAGAFSKDLIVRTAADPRVLMTAIQKELRSVDPTVAIENVRTLEQVRDDSVASRTFAMQLLVGFSIVASVLTLVGVYGVLSLSVASRRREIAVRSAVGAQQRDIRKLVFADAFRLIAGGVAAGIVAAVVLSRGLTSFLFEVEATDPRDTRRRRTAVRQRRAAGLLGAEPPRGADRSARGAAQRVGATQRRPYRRVCDAQPLPVLPARDDVALEREWFACLQRHRQANPADIR